MEHTTGDATLWQSRLSAAEAFELGTAAAGVRLDPGGEWVILYDHLLVEDDGPGIGSDSPHLKSDRAPTVLVGGAYRVKKLLFLDRPEALSARLYVPRGFAVEVNGTPLDVPRDRAYPEVPVGLLRAGENEVILSADERAPRPAKYAATADILRNAPERAGRPPCSFHSADGGETWQAIDGELMVRLHLTRYTEEGSLVSPVLDLWACDHTSPLARQAVSVHRVSLTSRTEMPGGTRVEWSIRTGTSPVFEDTSWGYWVPPSAPTSPKHRYLQWRAVLRTTNPLATPRVGPVWLEVEGVRHPPPDWLAGVTVLGCRNAEMRFTSIPFAHEDPNHPRLVSLRRRYALDDVVAGAATELGKLVRLRHWVSQQWQYQPPGEGYPAWDAHEILRRQVGFCVQYAVVYLQCAISLGYQARFVFGSHPGTFPAGHEVCEVWSNEYRKWVYMDPHQDEHYVDPKSGDPLSMLEVHERLLRAYYGEGAAAGDNRPRKPRWSDEIASCRGMEMKPADVTAADPSEWPSWTHWLHVRYLPRSDFYAHALPLPRTQGFTWDWPDYWCWSDAQTPTEWQYRHFTGRRSDLDWTLNQVRFDVAPGDEAGRLRVCMGTLTPGFETFLVKTDGQEWRPSGAVFTWELRPGRNHLQMRARNTSGVVGPISLMEVGC